MKTYFLSILFAGMIWSPITNEFKENKVIANSTEQNASSFRRNPVDENSSTKSLPKNTKITDILANNDKPTLASKLKRQTQPKNVATTKIRKKIYSYNLPWRKDKFTYSILKYTKDLSARVQERIFAKAFNIWHKAAPQLTFKFKRHHTKADITISFVKGAHGDRHAFDGSGPLIAHALSPEDGRMHFDDDEW